MPYILNTPEDIKQMLKAIGAASLEDLFSHLPEKIKLKRPLKLAAGLSEAQAKEIVAGLAQKNTPLDKFISFLGAGCYDHYVPAAVGYVVSQPEFTTAYTPYQAECSQGALQAIYEYQSYICRLTGMDVTNASMFDGASSLAESLLMALRVTGRNKVIVAKNIHPEYRKTLRTYLSGFDFKIQEAGFDKQGFVDKAALDKMIDQNCACVAFSNPNFFGLVEDSAGLCAAIKQKGALAVLACNPMTLALLRAPKDCGVDIVCGDGQPLGNNLNFGGPSFGFLATRDEYARQLPGRIVGRTLDKENATAYCLTLQTREQHIRREKATSNICSNQSLQAIAAAVYLALMGKEGFKQAAEYSLNLAHYMAGKLKENSAVGLPFADRFFHEFVWQIKDAKSVVAKLYDKGIIAGYYLGDVYPDLKDCVLSCCTEKTKKTDIDDFINVLNKI